MKIDGNTQKVEIASVEIEQEVPISASPQHVYDCFMNDIASWWSRSWVMGGPNTDNIIIEAEPGGRLLEHWQGGGGCIWAVVQSISPGRLVSFSIPAGVLWSGAGMFRVVFEAAEEGGGTLLKLSHHCFNMFQEDSHSGYVKGWTELIGTRLKSYAEGGRIADAIRPSGTQV